MENNKPTSSLVKYPFSEICIKSEFLDLIDKSYVYGYMMSKYCCCKECIYTNLYGDKVKRRMVEDDAQEEMLKTQ